MLTDSEIIDILMDKCDCPAIEDAELVPLFEVYAFARAIESAASQAQRDHDVELLAFNAHDPNTSLWLSKQPLGDSDGATR